MSCVYVFTSPIPIRFFACAQNDTFFEGFSFFYFILEEGISPTKDLTRIVFLVTYAAFPYELVLILKDPSVRSKVATEVHEGDKKGVLKGDMAYGVNIWP